MGIAKEQVVLAGTVLVLGWLAYDKLTVSTTRRSRARGGAELEFIQYPAPNLDVALRDSKRTGEFERDLFSPPRDTQPLPPLPLIQAPMEPLAVLAPPASRGPAPRFMGATLRRTPTTTLVADLFAAEESSEGFSEDAFSGAAAAAATTNTASTAQSDKPRLTADERAERIRGFKQLYDWIQLSSGRTHFGQIANSNRYTLSTRGTDAIEFIEVDPERGVELFEGQGAVAYTRDRISDFGFADTTANRLELMLGEFDDGLSAARVESALMFADECVASRLEAPRALDIAEQMYRNCVALVDSDPRPTLGLARCLEAKFEFESAWKLYDELLASGYDKSPVVHARKGALQARLRLTKDAEASFQNAVRWGRTNWEARWQYGRFLLNEQRGAEAVEHLDQATKFEPKSPETKAVRVKLRTDYGWALLSIGNVADAANWFGRALSADPTSQAALAGALSAARFVDSSSDDLAGLASAGAGGAVADASFDLLLALGLMEIKNADWANAKRDLELAAQADPFRAYQSWRALSYLAEMTGNPDAAISYIASAYENDPTDPYTLFQRGRLLAQQDDLVGAEESFKGALDADLDFGDALVAMAEIANRRGEYLAAERYFERALSIEPDRPLVHSLRGFNSLALDQVDAAEASFREALRNDPDLASARCGLAWCFYVNEDSAEATTQLADLVESRRNKPDDDPFKAYAEAQISRIVDHEEKEQWTDRFDRVSNLGTLSNGWQVGEDNGLTVSLRDKQVVLDGQIRQKGRARAFREINAADFVSFQAQVTVDPKTKADHIGLFVAYEIRRRGEWDVNSEASLTRHQDGGVQVRFIKQGERDAPYTDLVATEWRTGEPTTLRIERLGTGADTTFTLYVDGLPVTEPTRMPTLGRATTSVRFGLFVEGAAGRPVDVRMDDVEVVRRVQN